MAPQGNPITILHFNEAQDMQHWLALYTCPSPWVIALMTVGDLLLREQFPSLIHIHPRTPRIIHFLGGGGVVMMILAPNSPLSPDRTPRIISFGGQGGSS